MSGPPSAGRLTLPARSEVEAARDREGALGLGVVLGVAVGGRRERHALVGAGAIVDRRALEREDGLEGDLEDVVLELGADDETLARDVRLILEDEVQLAVVLVALLERIDVRR